MAERGLVAADEIEAGHALHPPQPVRGTLTPGDVAQTLYRGTPTAREPTGPARFAVGDRVRARAVSVPTHTRLPRYVRGHAGVVELVHGCHVFPDSSALGAGENPQWLYAVRFSGRELWGTDADPTAQVSVDAWSPTWSLPDGARSASRGASGRRRARNSARREGPVFREPWEAQLSR